VASTVPVAERLNTEQNAFLLECTIYSTLEPSNWWIAPLRTPEPMMSAHQGRFTDPWPGSWQPLGTSIAPTVLGVSLIERVDSGHPLDNLCRPTALSMMPDWSEPAFARLNMRDAEMQSILRRGVRAIPAYFMLGQETTDFAHRTIFRMCRIRDRVVALQQRPSPGERIYSTYSAGRLHA
jgi:hypothetical protein